MTDCDVLIVGGGPVGLAAAIEARLAGYEALVLEPRVAPVDKACGEGLMPGALTALHRLGVDPDGHRLTGIRYLDTSRRADHLFVAGPGRGVRRTTLHAALHDRSLELGVRHESLRVQQITQTSDGVTAGGLQGRWLLACDGLHSGVRRLSGLQPPRRRAALHRRHRRFGLRQHFQLPPWGELVEVHWGSGVEAYVTPVAEDVVGVALLGAAGMDYEAALAGFTELGARLDGAETLGPVRGAGPLRQHSRRRTAGRIRLVGDASGYVDALTGEGLRVGLAQARAAIATLEDGAAYEAAWSRATRDYRLLTSGLLAWATSPARGAIVPVAARIPRLYGAIVERLAQ